MLLIDKIKYIKWIMRQYILNYYYFREWINNLLQCLATPFFFFYLAAAFLSIFRSHYVIAGAPEARQKHRRHNPSFLFLKFTSMSCRETKHATVCVTLGFALHASRDHSYYFPKVTYVKQLNDLST